MLFSFSYSAASYVSWGSTKNPRDVWMTVFSSSSDNACYSLALHLVSVYMLINKLKSMSQSKIKSRRSLIEKIKEFEGFLPSYSSKLDGHATIGYGHVGKVNYGQPITKEQAEALLLLDVSNIEKQIDALKLGLSIERYEAVVDFVYNLGISNFKSSTLYRYIKKNADDTRIKDEFQRWVYCNGRMLEGLKKRRQWEAEHYFSLSQFLF